MIFYLSRSLNYKAITFGKLKFLMESESVDKATLLFSEKFAENKVHYHFNYVRRRLFYFSGKSYILNLNSLIYVHLLSYVLFCRSFNWGSYEFPRRLGFDCRHITVLFFYFIFNCAF